MSLWIKICGTTSLEDAQLAVEAGADALGFVFAPSPRRVSAAQVAAISPHLPEGVERIGVFVDASPQEIYEAVRMARLTGVQLHSAVGPEATARLRELLGAPLRILRVVHFGEDAEQQAAAAAHDLSVDAILVDSRTARAVGGTGVKFDWQKARDTLFGGSAKPMVVAGGLNPENVAEAIATLHPWGVDVVSGVEAEPGRKDADKVWAFVAQARAAAKAG